MTPRRDGSTAADAPAAKATPAHRPRVSRRDLLLAGTGLIVGAGATEAGNLLTDSSQPSSKRAATPGEDLMTEHGVLKRLLLAYQTAADQLGAGTTPPAGAISDAAQIIADFIEGFHEGLEEAYVFPRVRARQGSLVQTLLTQHDRGRHLTAAISAAAAQNLAEPKVRATLGRYLTLFVRMYAPHEAWEDTVIFPALREVSSQRTLDELAERFANLQSAQYGDNALDQMLARVAGIEQQLGIADLAAFTPPLIYRP